MTATERGQELRRLRTEAGYGLRELGRVSGVHFVVISEMEAGRRNHHLATYADKLVGFLGEGLTELVRQEVIDRIRDDLPGCIKEDARALLAAALVTV